ncbi:MAG: hypothetical protein J5703_00195 [Methanomicrobium sp.]|nr:hypothetical protein [Methanomicrobium sp.]MBO4521591.1 hypothetical protein [Methanomicrobium sp.]
MTDFIETGSSKSAVRVLTNPIADIGAFSAIVNAVLTENPFECTDYTAQGVVTAGVVKNREYYTSKFLYEDDNAKTVGNITLKSPTVEAFTQSASRIAADTALAENIGGDAVRDYDNDAFYCQLKCHDANGEIYYVTFSRTKVRISSFESDAVLAKVENWADSIPALA